MGKHNGKARKAGARVGSALVNSLHREGRGTGTPVHHLHTTTEGPNVQSMLEMNDLTELMDMANLAESDFLAERQQVVVLGSSMRTALDEERDAEARRQAEERNEHRLCIPRRPAWTPNMTPEQVDAQERAAFLHWRRDLAALEEQETLVLTPFEKNLEMWRQLWRVLERSDVVVQVVDARDPLFYRSTDLEAYALELSAQKRSLLLLNKADLLTYQQRLAWADACDHLGIQYAFWSAKAATAAAAAEKQYTELPLLRPPSPVSGKAIEPDMRARLMGVDELLDWMEAAARDAAVATKAEGTPAVVGLTGYPNVGKSSTINALYGKKKTAVAPTPGKTKHFQTLHVRPSLTLCDCPGLVLPRFAASKAEMVAAGVLPIDRLTEVRTPVEVVASRVPREALEAAYGFKLPRPKPHEPSNRSATGVELLRTLALARGWVVANGRPDESRAARQLLRDYTAGKLVYVRPPAGIGAWPADATAAQQASAAAAPVALEGPGSSGADAALPVTRISTAADSYDAAEGPSRGTTVDCQLHVHVARLADAAGEQVPADAEGCAEGTPAAGPASLEAQQRPTEVPAAAAHEAAQQQVEEVTAAAPLGEWMDELTAADLELLAHLNADAESGNKSKRAAHKFQRKPPRGKGTRGQLRHEGFEDGLALKTGRKGGLVRVGGYS